MDESRRKIYTKKIYTKKIEIKNIQREKSHL